MPSVVRFVRDPGPLTSCKCALRAHRRALLGTPPPDPSGKLPNALPSLCEFALCSPNGRSPEGVTACRERASEANWRATAVRREGVRDRDRTLTCGRPVLGGAATLMCMRLLGLRGSVRRGSLMGKSLTVCYQYILRCTSVEGRRCDNTHRWCQGVGAVGACAWGYYSCSCSCS